MKFIIKYPLILYLILTSGVQKQGVEKHPRKDKMIKISNANPVFKLQPTKCTHGFLSLCFVVVACANPSGQSLQWRHNERDGGSNHQPHDCLLNLLFRRRSKKTSELRATGPSGADRSGADRTQVGPMLAPRTLLSGTIPQQRLSGVHNPWGILIWVLSRKINTYAAYNIFPKSKDCAWASSYIYFTGIGCYMFMSLSNHKSS